MAEQKKDVKGGGVEIQLVIFDLAGEEFGLDISQVREINKNAEYHSHAKSA